MTLPPVETRWRALNWPGWARRAAALAFFVAVNWMLLAPAATFRDIHRFLAYQDKLAHGAIFLALAFLVRWSLPARGWRGGVGYAALAALLLYAGGIERFQPLVKGAGRMFEWADLLSNHAGVFAGWALLGRLAVDPSGVAGGGAAAETAPTWGRG